MKRIIGFVSMLFVAASLFAVNVGDSYRDPDNAYVLEVIDCSPDGYPVFKITYSSRLGYDMAVEGYVESDNISRLEQYPDDLTVIVSWKDGFGFGGA